jgi:ketosteroid isomerase-like protein
VACSTDVNASEQKLDIVRRVYRAANEDERDAFLALLHPEIELQTSGVYPDFRARYRGLEAAADYWEDARGLWQDFSIEIEGLEEAGDCVVALLRQRVEGREGIVVEHGWGHVYWFSEGLVRRVVAYASWNEALDAVGLERRS